MSASKKRILWLSRHGCSEEQRILLVSSVGGEADFNVSQVMWRNSSSEEADNEANARKWAELASKYDIVVGIFPPVALVGLVTARGIASGDEASSEEADCSFSAVRELRVLTPVSETGTLTLPDGSKKKSFRFLRWQEF
jgi:hypothetical protein